ncbi:hypothetical protein GF373_16610, partial [bacterium]|nr:hypothetical protein [bacterium]
GNPRMEHVYLIEPLEKQEKRPKTLDEARNEIAEKVKQEKAADIAAVAAQEDINRVKEENLTLEQIAENRGLSIQTSSLFSKQDQFIPEFGRAPMQLVNTAFNLEEGQVTGPFTVNQNTCIIRLLTREEPYIPEFEEVSEQVKSDYRRYLAEREARRDAGIFSDTVFEKGISLQAGANEKGVEYQETDFFAQNQPIPDLGFKRNLSQAAFEMDETGIVSREVEERTRNPRQRTEGPVEAYYVFELLEIKETYLPEFQEVAGDVEEDYRLVLAEDVAVEKAGQTLNAIKSELASGQPYSSTRAINLEAFAEDGQKNVTEGANYNGPIDVNGLGSVPGVGRAVEFAKTALSLEKGQVSGLVKNYRQKRTQQDERPQQGPMTGVYILQSLGAVEPAETEADTINRFTQMVDRQMGSSAFAAWVDEVSAAATIDYNDEYFNPEQEDTEGMEESEVAQDETASS